MALLAFSVVASLETELSVVKPIASVEDGLGVRVTLTVNSKTGASEVEIVGYSVGTSVNGASDEVTGFPVEFTGFSVVVVGFSDDVVGGWAVAGFCVVVGVVVVGI